MYMLQGMNNAKKLACIFVDIHTGTCVHIQTCIRVYTVVNLMCIQVKLKQTTLQLATDKTDKAKSSAESTNTSSGTVDKLYMNIIICNYLIQE